MDRKMEGGSEGLSSWGKNGTEVPWEGNRVIWRAALTPRGKTSSKESIQGMILPGHSGWTNSLCQHETKKEFQLHGETVCLKYTWVWECTLSGSHDKDNTMISVTHSQCWFLSTLCVPWTRGQFALNSFTSVAASLLSAVPASVREAAGASSKGHYTCSGFHRPGVYYAPHNKPRVVMSYWSPILLLRGSYREHSWVSQALVLH